MKITTTGDGRVSYRFAGGKLTFEMPTIDPTIANGHQDPLVIFHGTAETFDAAVTDVLGIQADKDLSQAGAERKLITPRTRAVVAVASGWASIDQYAAGLDAREQTLLRVPEIHATHAAVAQEDSELRAWFNSQDPKAKSSLLQRMEQGPELGRLVLALLRGPGPLMVLDHEVALARELWNRQARMNNLGEAIAIANGKVTVDYAQRSLAHIAGSAGRVLGWGSDRVLRALISSGNERAVAGIEAFGFSEHQALAMKAQLEARQFEGVV